MVPREAQPLLDMSLHLETCPTELPLLPSPHPTTTGPRPPTQGSGQAVEQAGQSCWTLTASALWPQRGLPAPSAEDSRALATTRAPTWASTGGHASALGFPMTRQPGAPLGDPGPGKEVAWRGGPAPRACSRVEVVLLVGGPTGHSSLPGGPCRQWPLCSYLSRGSCRKGPQGARGVPCVL